LADKRRVNLFGKETLLKGKKEGEFKGVLAFWSICRKRFKTLSRRIFQIMVQVKGNCLLLIPLAEETINNARKNTAEVLC